jgi:hypothetical protein
VSDAPFEAARHANYYPLRRKHILQKFVASVIAVGGIRANIR